jgi:hypothetical protein
MQVTCTKKEFCNTDPIFMLISDMLVIKDSEIRYLKVYLQCKVPKILIIEIARLHHAL